MRVLYLSHAAELGGAERSLLELIDALPDGIEAELACPAGELASAARARGITVREMAPARSAFRRRNGGLRVSPTGVAPAVVALGAGARRVAGLARRRFSLVHANSLRAGLTACLATRLGGPPVVVHARDVVLGPDSRVVLSEIRRTAAVTIANSAATAAHLRRGGVESLVVAGFADTARFDPARVDRAKARQRLGLGRGELVLSVVGRLAPEKGQARAVRALARIDRRDARLLLVGSARFAHQANRADVEGYVASLHELARELGVAERVSFLGEREDTPAVLAASDVLLAPSSEEPFGRAVAEGMAMALPVLATDRGGTAELIEDGVSGLLLPPDDPPAWAGAIDRLAGDPALGRRLGERARARIVGSFGRTAHVREVAAVYAAIEPAAV